MFSSMYRCVALILLLILTVRMTAQEGQHEENAEPKCTLAEQIMSSNTGEKVGSCPVLEGMEGYQLKKILS